MPGIDTMGTSVRDRTDLLVVGAGPYAYAAAACARESGIETRVVGRPMSFWREQMPADMYLRSSTDWHLDANAEHTFAAYVEEKGHDPADLDPVPIAVFLDYTDWFADRKRLDVDTRLVDRLTARDAGGFVAQMADGSTIEAEKVLAAPGIRTFAHHPDWHTAVPAERRSHTSELVSFDELAGGRVVVVGGRQSAYEWAALLCDHGAARVDVVHRHATPSFDRVSWAFADAYVEQTLAHRGWWRSLPADRQKTVAAEFWQVGRLPLEHWIAPRLRPEGVPSRPGTEVTDVGPGDDAVRLRLSDGESLEADHVVFASGYRADLATVPYLEPLLDRVSVTNGFPDLSEGFETTLPGLFVTGFASTRDFGPFYGFTKGCPSAARITVDEMLR